eukprot:3326749-Rhodomonas_salina.2
MGVPGLTDWVDEHGNYGPDEGDGRRVQPRAFLLQVHLQQPLLADLTALEPFDRLPCPLVSPRPRTRGARTRAQA